ncbi:MAG: SDR family oxidoreductase [Rhizonema sp. PD38]|nr:SDR family oxidoreductase [Rhizonema sp. PD38]
MSNNVSKIALVTGANKGLGFEISKQLAKQEIQVILGARDIAKGQEAAEKLKQQGLDVYPLTLDINNVESIQSAVNTIKEKFGTLHILVNNAGVMLDWTTSVFDVSLDTLTQTLQTNIYGAFQLCQLCIPLMKASGYGRIVNMSSTLGSLTDMSDLNSHYDSVQGPSYRLSKTALNAVTAIFARELGGTNILINSACPGWVQTDMGSEAAPLSIEQGADTPVWLATLPDGGPHGGFFNSRKPVAW